MLKYALIAGLIMVQAPFAQKAEAFDLEKEAVKFISKVSGKQNFCRKGSFFSGIVSVRSFKGALCDRKSIALVALKRCPGIDGFEDSDCFKKAQKFTQGKTVNQAIVESAKEDPEIAELLKDTARD